MATATSWWISRRIEYPSPRKPQKNTKELHIAGAAVIEGVIDLKGNILNTGKLFQDLAEHSATTMRNELRDGMMSQFADQVFNKISTEGLDPSVFTYQGHRLIKDNGLAPTILNSNLQKVGALKELQVIGETLLDETLYVSNGRVGVNTMDPESALDVWDQEVELVFAKQEQNMGLLGSPKPHRMVLSVNKNYNLVLDPDGSVSVAVLNINGVRHTSSDVIPTEDAVRGTIVWNSNPKIGAPVGYVSLGGGRWANFGSISA